jgi:hypothetical protein
MSDTQKFDKNSRIIRTLCQYFKVVGLVEVFLFVSILNAAGVGFLVILLGITPGLITVLSADSIFKKNKERRGYFVAIWNMLKYNPISYSMLLFILGDFLYAGNSIAPYAVISMALLGIISFVCGIILAVKISKHNRILSNL